LISQAISDISITNKDHLKRRASRGSPSSEMRGPPPTLKSKVPSNKQKFEKVSIFFGDHASQHSKKESERYKEYDEDTVKYESGDSPDKHSDYDNTVVIDSN
jgi:hypothetical protein